MKRILVVLVVLTAVMLVAAGAAMAGIAGGKHDMRTHLTGQTGGYDEVCVYCHTPHSARTTLPLWNRNDPTSTYTPYTSSTMNHSTAQGYDSALGAGSLACMSCHDGSIAVDALYNLPNYGTVGTDNSANLNASKQLVLGNAALGTDLSNDHPVGFTYTPSVDADLVAILTVRGNSNVRLFGPAGAEDQVECASCHDAHNTTDMPFLRASNAGSVICLACHNK